MERIKLDRKEKAVLRALLRGDGRRAVGLDPQEWSDAVDALEEHGLAQGVWASGHELVAARVTNRGRDYLAEWPGLPDPTDSARSGWRWWVERLLDLLKVGLLLLLCYLAVRCQG